MESNNNQVSNVLDVRFGGVGARQAIGEALKDVEHFTSAFILAINEDGEVEIYHSSMDKKDLALMAMKMQGYALGMINDWLEEE